jgi:hypothetical protein
MQNMEWQPIGTAPKDGTVVMLVNDNDIFLGSYDDGYIEGYEWRIHIDGCHAGQPTHWMPLPEPPSLAKN